MKLLVVPMMAMAESSGPTKRACALARAAAERGWDVGLCVPTGGDGDAPDGIREVEMELPSPLGLPRAIGKRMFPIAQRLGLNRHAQIRCFDDVLRLTGNVDGPFLARSVEQLRGVLARGGHDAVYAEFSLPAVIAARAEGVPVFGSTSYPTQPSFASNPSTASGVNSVLTSLDMDPVHSPEDVLLMPKRLFVPSCRQLEPFPRSASVTFTGPFSGFRMASHRTGALSKDSVVVYMGNGAITPRHALKVVCEAVHGMNLEVFVAGLSREDADNVHTAPFFDFSKILPRAVAFINHGGQNSIMEGIGNAVPQIICPGSVFERRFNAEACEAAGVAKVIEASDFDAHAIRELLVGVVSDGTALRQSALSLRAEMENLGGAQQVLDRMECCELD